MSYLRKVMHPITIIGKIEPDKTYTTNEAVRVLSCGFHVLVDLAKAGDVGGAKSCERGRWSFKGSDLIDLAVKHNKIRQEMQKERQERHRENNRKWRAADRARRNAQKQATQQALTFTDKPKRGRPPKPEGSKAATWEKLTVYLPVDVATALRHRAVDERCDLSDIIANKLIAAFAA